jgi:hypothetical protein
VEVRNRRGVAHLGVGDGIRVAAGRNPREVAGHIRAAVVGPEAETHQAAGRTRTPPAVAAGLLAPAHRCSSTLALPIIWRFDVRLLSRAGGLPS